MDLEELLVNAYDLGRRVVIVENMGEGVTQVKDAATKLNELTNEVFDRPVSTVIIHPDKFTKSLDGNVMQAIDSQGVLKEMPGINKNDIVLFSGYTPGSFPHLRDVLISMCAMKQMQEKMPNIPSTNYAFVLPSGERGGCLERVWKQVLGLFEGANQEFFEHAVYGPIPQRGASSLVGVLRSEAGVLQHNVGSLRDARFMDALSAQFAKGCNQTSLEKTFLCINEKLKEKKGKFEVISPDAQVDELDFSKYYAVFINNGWENQEGRLGKGITTLMNVSRALQAKKLKVPIIYQTAHPLESVSEEERARVESFPNTFLIAKNLAPKISRSRKVAVKELEASRLLAESQGLAGYVVQAVPVGKEGFVKINDRFMTFTKAALVPEGLNELQSSIYQKAGVDHSDLTNHRMYVLANLHSHLTSSVANQSLALVGKNFREFDEILGEISKKGSRGNIESLVGLRKVYEQAVNDHTQLGVQTVIHNDAKWDNWFNDYVLGDFGSMCPGRESKDLASALIDPKDNFGKTMNEDYVDGAIKNYIALRKTINPEFNQDFNQMRREVYGMLVVESLKQAFYKVRYDSKLTEGLIAIASRYAHLYEKSS